MSIACSMCEQLTPDINCSECPVAMKPKQTSEKYQEFRNWLLENVIGIDWDRRDVDECNKMADEVIARAKSVVYDD